MSEGTTCHKRVKCTRRGTAHIVPVPGVMGVKDFALNYANILERYKFRKIWQFFSLWQRQNYRQQALCLRINPHFSVEQNCERHKIYGAWGGKRLHINEQTSWILFVTFANFSYVFYRGPVCHFSWWCGWWWVWPLWWNSGHSAQLWGRR